MGHKRERRADPKREIICAGVACDDGLLFVQRFLPGADRPQGENDLRV